MRSRSLHFASLALTALTACRASTEVTIEVTTDVPCHLQSTGIAVGLLGAELEDAPPATTTVKCDADGHVGVLVVVPSGDNNGPIAVKVVGGVDVAADACSEKDGFKGCIVARRALHFVPHENLRLAVPLRANCKDVPCGANETCVQKACIPATLASPEKCASAICDEGALEGGAGADAGPPDAGPQDAAPDASADGAVPAVCGATCGGRIALGDHHSCALAADDSVVCWGVSSNGQLGRGALASNAAGAVRLSSLDPLGPVAAIVAGGDRTCAFRNDGSVSCWGDASGGVFGASADGALSYASHVAVLDGAVDIGLGKTHTCWRTSGTALFCIGDGTENALGTPAASSTSPVVPEIAGPFAQLASSDKWSCVVKTDRSVWCFGANGSAQSDPSVPQITPTFPAKKVDVAVSFAEVRLAVDTTCARTSPDGRIVCWGDSNWGQAGVDGNDGGASTVAPNAIVGADRKTAVTGAAQIAMGYDHGCARMGDGRVMCWGADAFGNLGRGNAINDSAQSYFADYVVDGAGAGTQLNGVIAIAAGGDHTCAMKANGEVWCWGRNADGELGLSDTDAHSIPVRVSF